MAPDAETPFPDPEAETPPSRRRGIGLCLSGGGFRATLFHAGAIQRLFELGIATRPDFDTVASVSGGSLTAAQWAIATSLREASPNQHPLTADDEHNPPSLRGAITRLATKQTPSRNYQATFLEPLLALTAKDIRTGAMAKKFLLPWNWFRGAYALNAMVDKFEAPFGKATLNLLPERPRFIFCATDMAFGASFIFEGDRWKQYDLTQPPGSGRRVTWTELR